MALGRFSMELLIAGAVIEGILEVFSGLAERTYIGSLVPQDRASAAQVRIEARTHVVLVAGRLLGGLLFEIRPILPFIADVVSFIFSVITLIGIGGIEWAITASDRRLSPKHDLQNEMRQGLRWMFQDRFARRVIVSFSGGTLIFQSLMMVFLGDAHARKLSAFAIGMTLAASGVGGALGSVVASRVLAKAGHSWVRIQTISWCIGLALLALPAEREFLFVAIIMTALGFTGALGNIVLDTHLIQRVDQEMLARVTSVGRLMTFTACAIGPVMGGVLVQELDTQLAMLFLFLVFVITQVLLLISAVVGRVYDGSVPQVSDGSILV
jgi:predicted MFS family arabinose efflux permease